MPQPAHVSRLISAFFLVARAISIRQTLSPTASFPLGNTMTQLPFLRPNLVGRISNYSLSPTVPANTLVPLYEATFNSLHALQKRFGDQWMKNGKIAVAQTDKTLNTVSFSITDNGIGLNDENFQSFQTYDSPYKKTLGGKGIGRLAWLKVFDSVSVSSVFESNNAYYRRTFDFVLDNNDPFKNYNIAPTNDPLGTTIILHNMKTEYYAHLPARIETITNKLIGHFIAYLVGNEVPHIEIADDNERILISEHLQNRRTVLDTTSFKLDEHELTIDHTLLGRALAEGGAKHRLFYAADRRIVLEQDISAPLGLATLVERNGEKYTYIGIVSGNILDDSVNTERTRFDLSRELFDGINRRAIAEANTILFEDISRVIERQEDLVRAVLNKYPRYSYLVSDAREYVVENIPRSVNKAESVYQQFALQDFRETRRIEREVDAALKPPTNADADEVIREKTGELLARLTDQEFSALADYTAKRKVIIDLLESRLGYMPDGSMRNYAEDAIHSIICPLRVTKSDVDLDRHNLWIIDDKLTYYDFWASDNQIKEYMQGTDSAKRPDIALFSGQTLFLRDGTKQPIVIVEFKRPARNSYDYEHNPITQTYEYIEELRGRKVRRPDGSIIDYITDDHPFFCYIIADFTLNLEKYLKATQINTPLPGGTGYYGFNPDYKVFFQILNYRYLVTDARLRNEAFFKRLAI